jgi:plasmid maintenance system antidote protein VapI
MDRSVKSNAGEFDIHVQDGYDPGRLFDQLLHRFNLTRDNDLARLLKMDKRLLSEIRQRRQDISGSMLLRMQDLTGLTIAELRFLLHDRRKTSRMVCRANT